MRRFRGLEVLLVFSVTLTGMMPGQFAMAESPSRLERIRVAPDGRRFIFTASGREFCPWGFNYDHDAGNRLLETYWMKEWDKVAGDFAEMKALGANTVRVHLQVSRFMRSAQEINRTSLDQLARLLTLAESNRIYLDITGLGCYDRNDVPKWYNDLDETQRWAVQARFWSAVALTCRDSPAVFCHDLMNEPVLTEDKQGRDWTPGSFAGFCFVQRLTLDFAGRKPEHIAAAWLNQMVAAIRQHDRQTLITVGAIPWAMTWPNARPGLEASTNLDFVSVHFYPKQGEVDRALTALKVYDVGKPVVIEEMFPLECSVRELDEFIDRSRPPAVGWIGFYWGRTMEEYRRERNNLSEAITLDWLEYFARKAPQMLRR